MHNVIEYFLDVVYRKGTIAHHGKFGRLDTRSTYDCMSGAILMGSLLRLNHVSVLDICTGRARGTGPHRMYLDPEGMLEAPVGIYSRA